MPKGFIANLRKLTGNRRDVQPLIRLTTTGARTGQRHETPLTRFGDDRPGSWLVVAAGADRCPDWYHNVRANPGDVWIGIGGETAPAEAEQLYGAERDQAWQRITSTAPRFLEYQAQARHQLPILRLTPR